MILHTLSKKMRQVPGNLTDQRERAVNFLIAPYLQVFHLQTEENPILTSSVYFKTGKCPPLDPRG